MFCLIRNEMPKYALHLGSRHEGRVRGGGVGLKRTAFMEKDKGECCEMLFGRRSEYGWGRDSNSLIAN